MPDYTQHKYNTLMALLGKGAEMGSAGATQAMRGQQELAKGQQDLQSKQTMQDTGMKNLASLFGIDTKAPTPQPDNAPSPGEMGPPSPTPEQAAFKPQPGPSWQQQLGDQLSKHGAGFHLADNGVSVTPDPTAKLLAAAPKEAQAFLKTAGAAYKPLNDQLDASKATLDYLNQKNASSDKMALINEARLAAGQGGSRALKGIMDSLSGGKTGAMDFQNTLNYINNTSDIPTMQDSQRDALREVVYGRLPQLGALHTQAQAQLAQQGPIVAPHADHAGLTSSFTTPAQAKLDQLNQMGKDYQSQRAALKSRPIGAGAATADPSQSNWGKITSGIGGLLGAKSAPTQQSPATGPHGPSVIQNGQTYTWNPQSGQYE